MAQDFKINWFGRQVFELATEVNFDAMKRAAFIVEADTKKSFGTSASRSDIKSRRTKSGKFHRPSAPGFPPNIDIGVLKSSVQSFVKKSFDKVEGKVGPDIDMIAAKAETGTDVNYGFFLEIGTSKMQPRPYLRPALKKNHRRILRIFRRANGR